jgi:arylsulfatase A-like enzyme
VLAVAGASVGAVVFAGFEGTRASRAWYAPAGATAVADAAVLVPIATFLGLGVAFAMMALDPDRRWRPAILAARMRTMGPETRARAGALAFLAPVATLAWIVVSAHAARAQLLHEAQAWPVGAAIASTSVLALGLAAATTLALVPGASRTLTARLPPALAGACGLSFALGCGVLGVRIGDTSGNGSTPLAILGVLARRELDLTPVLGLSVIVLGALLAERATRDGRWGRVAVGAVVVSAAWGLLVQQAYALNADPTVAHAVELGAPLGHYGMAALRKATDHDKDGASPLFGGGDCDDDDPGRSPYATDVPGNGVDEDCSGADTPPPKKAPPAPPPPRAAVPPDLNLVLITVDTLRIDVGFMGYPRPVTPNLDALAAKSTVFDRMYSMASYTGKSVGPTLIGKYPSETLRDGAHFDTYFADNTFLAERLHEAGFHTMGLASHWYFKPKFGLTQGMDTWDMSAMPPEGSGDIDGAITSQALGDAAIRLLSNPANTSGRFFLWAHFFDPHANYMQHPEAPSFRAGATNWSKPLYDGEVWFTDHHIGRVLDYIASQPWGKKTAIVVTADHGEAFDEHGMSFHGVDLWEPLVRVPFVVYVPGAKPHRVKQKRSLVDVVPTMLDLMGIKQPPEGQLSGESNAAAIVSPDEIAIEERDVFIDMPAGPQVLQHRALIHGPTPGMKLLAEGGPVNLVFDLSRDEAEADDLSHKNRAELGRLLEAFNEKLATLHEIHVDPAPYDARP